MASSDENGGGLEEDEVDEDGLSVATLEQRFDKTLPGIAWYVKMLLCFIMNDSECSGKCAVIRHLYWRVNSDAVEKLAVPVVNV